MATTYSTRSKRTESSSVQYKRPLSLSPWGKPEGSNNGSVWISMKPKKILDQYTKGAGAYDTEEINAEFLFLAPLNLNENIVHHWEAYESVASRLAQKARSIVKLGAETSALIKAGENFFSESNVKNIFSKNAINEGATIEDFATRAYGAVRGSKIPKIKVDTPLYYSNSDRRQIVFEFQLFNESVQGYKTDEILVKPIQDLMKFSSPDLLNNAGIQIEFPYMWEIKTEPVNFIHYTTCALTGVQPTWNSPYVNGYPSSCNLQLTFVDLSPLYAGTIQYGSIINVKKGSVSEATERDRQAEKKYKVKPGVKRLSARQKVTGV